MSQGAWFALAKARDDLGRHAEAFDCLNKGHALRARSETAGAEPGIDMMSRLKEVFTEALFSAAGPGHPSSDPVLIVRMPRSGTTLTEQILASHPSVAGAGELPLLGSLHQNLPDMAGVETGFPECMPDVPMEVLTEFAETVYLPRLRAVGDGASLITDKMPHNFINLGLFALMFPRGRIVHCRRNPIDTCVSIYFQNFAGSHPYAHDLHELGRYYRAYEDLMDHWHRVLPMPVLDMDYGRTVSDSETEARRLIEFCGLEWDPSVTRFHESSRTVKTASIWQVRQPIYTASVERWRKYESALGPLLDGLGLNP